MTLRAIIVDDEALARRGLSLRLAKMPDVEVIAECSNGKEALDAVAELQPDLLFLDIQMPGVDGFEVVRQLQGDSMPMVIFVTAFDQFAVDAFQVHAVDYLLKPIDEVRLAESIKRAVEIRSTREALAEKEHLVNVVLEITGKKPATFTKNIAATKKWPDKLSIKDAGEVQLVPVNTIDWVDAARDYMCIHAEKTTHIMRITMKELESLLDPEVFLRIHRSTLVNKNRICSAQSLTNGVYLLSVDGGSKLKVSRSYRERIADFLQNSND
ncbi:MAG: two-component system LytT family response regulator [Oceanicoccus sp.]|jgi:two-component system LytT family response regulator